MRFLGPGFPEPGVVVTGAAAPLTGVATGLAVAFVIFVAL